MHLALPHAAELGDVMLDNLVVDDLEAQPHG